MLYYAFEKYGIVRAIYNGRLAFLHCESRRELDALASLRGENDFRLLWKPPVKSENKASGMLAEILAHEYVHKHIFSRSSVGLMLNGWRFWARAKYLFGGSEDAVTNYYRARTVYFQHTRDDHEDIVAQVEGVGKSAAHNRIDRFEQLVDEQYADRIASVDETVLSQWAEMSILPSWHLRKLYIATGKRLQKDFAVVVSYRDEKKKWHETWLADAGLLNDVKEHRKGETQLARSLKKLLNRIRLEPLSEKQTFDTDLRWFLLGQRAQCEVLQSHYGLKFEDIKKRILATMLPFIMEWSGLPLSQQSLIYTMGEDVYGLSPDKFRENWDAKIKEWREDIQFRKFINFFYLHGN